MHSFAQELELNCPKCKQHFSVELWLVVNIAERQDLVERIRAGQLHAFRCPTCEFMGKVNLPLLIFRPNLIPHVLFSPAQAISQEEKKKQADALIGELQDVAGAAWQDSWLENGQLPIVERDVLPIVVGENMSPDQQELVEQKTWGFEKLRTENPERYLDVMLSVWLDADSAAEKRKILESTPELLSPQVETRLITLLANGPENESDQARQFLQVHQDLLTACRVDGTAAAFEQLEKNEAMWLNLPDELQEIVDKLYGSERHSDMRRRMELCQQVLFRVSKETHPLLWAATQHELANILALIPISEREAIEQAIYHYRLALEVYHRERYPRSWAITQQCMGNTYYRRIEGERTENIDQAIYHFEQVLEVYDRKKFRKEWGWIQRALGVAYQDRIWGERSENIEQAIYHYEMALEVYTSKETPEDWAFIQYYLAAAYNDRIRGEEAENLEKAILHYEQVLEVYTLKDSPEMWAYSHYSLGMAYWMRTLGERKNNIERAIDYFQRSLEVYTRQGQPQVWAKIHSNLGNAYEKLSQGEPGGKIEHAIHHYQLALQVCTRDIDPEQWAHIHMRLGNIYKNRVIGTVADNLEQAICHYQEALEVKSQQAFPQDWARIQNNLAAVYANRIQGQRSENIEKSIYYFQQILEVFTRQAELDIWADIQANLGSVYEQRIRGDHLDNIEQAIQHYTNALEVYNRQEFPERWVLTETNLAHVYFERIHGVRNDNLEQSFQHYTNALTVYTRVLYPEQWAEIQTMLGMIYMERLHGKSGNYIEQVIQHYTNALEVYTSQASPNQWALIQNILASAYMERTGGDLSENFEQAIQYSIGALEIFSRQEFPEDWARSQQLLASAYTGRIHGERAKNLEQAIYHYSNALEVYTRQDFPEQWAMVQHDLSTAYRNHIRGDRADNLEQAIQCSINALEIFTLQTNPEMWAGTHHNLASAYEDRIRGDRAENIELAIHHCTNALEVFTREFSPKDWAMSQANLAIAYQHRIHGDRADQIEQAIQHYNNALEVFTRESFPKDWAMNQYNLANILIHRIHGEKSDNLDRAIQCDTDALKVCTRQAFPQLWAMIQSSLGRAYTMRINGERANNLEQAIQHHTNALEVYTIIDFPEDWATTQTDLGNAYSERIHGQKADNVEAAIQYFNNSLRIHTRQAFSESWALVQANLARAYRNRIYNDKDINLELAIQCYTNALEVMQDPVIRRNLAEVAGRLGAEMGNWLAAADIFLTAIEADEYLFRASISSKESREILLKQSQRLYSECAYALVRVGNLQKAVEVIESGRARQMGEILESTRRDLEDLKRTGFGTLAGAYTTALQERKNLLAMDQASRPDNWLMLLSTSNDAQEQAAREIREQIGPLQPEFCYFMQTLPFNVIQAQAKNSPLVYIFAAQHGGVALVVTKQEVRSILIEKLTLHSLYDFVLARDNSYLRAYMRRNENRSGFSNWLSLLESAVEWAWQTALNVITSLLKELDIQQVVLIPAGLLALLPLHAAILLNDRKNRKPICITYAPMARALLEVYERAKENLPNSLLAIDNPNPEGALQLPSSGDEVRAIKAWFDERNVCSFSGRDATRKHILEELSRYNVLHFSTHGFANFNEPLTSAILAANEEQLTLADFHELKLDHARLAVLSACETGIPADLSILDEVVSLPSGLMQAGVPGIIGTLWSVADASTAILMVRFYELWRTDGLTAPQALCKAQQWLQCSTVRELQDYFKEDWKKFEYQSAKLPTESADAFFKYVSLMGAPEDIPFWHPYFWAGFTYTGI
jgi:CHAT domain-containing protein